MEERYLKILKIVVDHSEQAIWQQAWRLAEKIKEQGLKVSVGNGGLNGDGLDESGHDVLKLPTSGMPESTGEAEEKGCLYLTDSAEMVQKLVGKQLPVMVWLHEENRSCSFGEIRFAVEEPEELDADFYECIYRRYAGIPWTIAETEHCLIRESTPEDAERFAEIYQEPEMMKYTEPFCTEAGTERETIREYIQKFYEFYGFGVWTVLWKATGEVIGRVGFEQPAAPALGYMIALPWQGKGLATEVCLAALKIAETELGFEEVQAVIHRENAASLRVAEKLGFHRISEGEEVILKKQLHPIDF